MVDNRSFGGLDGWEALERTPVTKSRDPLVQELLKACAAGDRVCIYYSGGSGAPQERWIRPQSVFIKAGYPATYVEAFCEVRQAVRVFRTDRMRLITRPGRSAGRPGTEVSSVGPVPPGPRQSPSLSGTRHRAAVPEKALRTKPVWQCFNRLISYYLDCIREDEGFRVAVRLRDAGDKWLPLPHKREWSGSGEEVLEAELTAADKPFTSYLLQSGLSSSLLYGYPILLKQTQEGEVAVYPVLLLPLDHEIDGLRLRLRRADDWPRLNAELVQALDLRREETRALLDVLGLGLSGSEAPEDGLASIAPRLAESDAFAEIAEDIDPQCLTTPLTRPVKVKGSGVFNWSGIFFSDRPIYTKTLERELTQLRDSVSESDLAHSALGFFFDQASLSGNGRHRQREPEVVSVSPLNEAQIEAVRAGLAAPVAVITGPPGTGKSQVVVNLLANALLTGQSVLFSSRNNKAVEVVEARTSALSKGRLLLRAGSRYSSRDFRAEIVKFLTHALATQAGEAERAEAQRLRARLGVIRGRRVSILDQLERVREARDRVSELDAQLAPTLETMAPNRRMQLDALARDPVLAQARKVVGLAPGGAASGGGVRAGKSVGLFRHWRNKRVARKIAGLLQGYDDLVPAVLQPARLPTTGRTELARGLAELTQTLDVASDLCEYQRAFELLKKVPGPEVLAEQMQDLEEEALDVGQALVDVEGELVAARLDPSSRRALGQLKATMERLSGETLGSSAYAKLRGELNSVFPEVTRAVPLWCVTNLSAGGTFPLGAGLFDLVVIDEASQCDIPSAIPLLFRAKRAMIIGDPNQLRHISKLPRLRDRQLQHLYGLDNASDQPFTFGANSLFDLASSAAAGVRVAELTEHFRSHEEIVRFSNRHWYGGRLRVCTDYARLAKVPGGPGVVWTDTAGTRAGGVSRLRNTAPHEAETLVRLLCELVNGDGFRGSIGVVTPFRAQANLIKQLVTERLDPEDIRRTNLIVDTAHGFQGDERDVVFLSLCVCHDLSLGGRFFLTDTANLFNVAITRSRSRLHVVGDVEACLTCGIDYIERFAGEYGSYRQAPDSDQLPWTNPGDNVGYYEAPLYNGLVAQGLKPIPQYTEGPYKLDLALLQGDLKLDIEVDGEYFHLTWSGDQARLDLRRDIRLIERGWKIKRFWAQEVRDDLDRCVREVMLLIEEASGG